jgi:hypothetical protein
MHLRPAEAERLYMPLEDVRVGKRGDKLKVEWLGGSHTNIIRRAADRSNEVKFALFIAQTDRRRVNV